MILKYWHRLSQLGVKSSMEIEVQKKIILSNQISVIFFFVFFILNITIHVFYVPQSIWTHLSTFTILVMPILNYYGYNRLTSILVNILTPAITVVASASAKISVIDNVPIYSYIFPKFLLISYISIPFILIGKKDKILLYLMVIVHLCFIFSYDYVHKLLGVNFENVKIDTSVYSSTDIFNIFPILIIVLGYLFLININSKYENKVLQLLNELETKNQDIELKNKNITDSIRYAKKIQTAFLPKIEIIENTLPNSFILYLPRDIVSGDFYWIRQIENLHIIIAADCTGHGVPGAFLSILGTTLLNDIIVSKNVLKPNQILDELRIAVINSLNQYATTNENKDGMDISVCVYNSKTNILEYSGANNSLFIIRENNFIEYKADHQPVGIYRNEKPFTLHEIKLNSNDCFYIFSDGYSSQFGGPKNAKLKAGRFKDYLLTVSKLNISSQKSELENMLKIWQGNSEQIDDILVIGVKN